MIYHASVPHNFKLNLLFHPQKASFIIPFQNVHMCAVLLQQIDTKTHVPHQHRGQICSTVTCGLMWPDVSFKWNTKHTSCVFCWFLCKSKRRHFRHLMTCDCSLPLQMSWLRIKRTQMQYYRDTDKKLRWFSFININLAGRKKAGGKLQGLKQQVSVAAR